MRLKNFLIASAVVTFAIGFTSCKTNNTSTKTDTATETKAQADDQSFFLRGANFGKAGGGFVEAEIDDDVAVVND